MCPVCYSCCGKGGHMNQKIFRKLGLSVLVLFTLSTSALADVVKIISINGYESFYHNNTLAVREGDVISLGADIIEPVWGDWRKTYRPAADFIWSADTGDYCDRNDYYRCSGSRFEPTYGGVYFRVPYTSGYRTIRITVRHRFEGGIDTLYLDVLNSYPDPRPYPPRPDPRPAPRPPRPEPRPEPRPPRPEPRPQPRPEPRPAPRPPVYP